MRQELVIFRSAATQYIGGAVANCKYLILLMKFNCDCRAKYLIISLDFEFDSAGSGFDTPRGIHFPATEKTKYQKRQTCQINEGIQF
jgi:hypothetical protein